MVIQIGDKHIYQGTDIETIQESFRLALQKVFNVSKETQLHPLELKEAVCEFLADIEAEFQYLKLFHAPQKNVSLIDQYIPIQVTLERRYQHKTNESFRSYGESEEEVKHLYAMKGRLEEFQRTQVDWQEAKKEHQKIMVLADPAMGKSTLLRREAVIIAKEERERLLSLESSQLSLIQEDSETSESVKKAQEKAILQAFEAVKFPLYLRLSDLAEDEGAIIEIIPRLIERNYSKTSKKVEALLRDKLEKGQCFLFLDALDEVPKEKRLQLENILNPFIKSYNCPVICTSRIVGYSSFLNDGKEMEIVPFTEKQTTGYIESWFKNTANFLEDKQVSAASLINELQTKPQIQGLTQNPLLLSLVCSLYQTKNLELPARRTQVYEKAVDYMLTKWGVKEGDKRPTLVTEGMSKRNTKQKLLEAIAYYFSCQQKEVFSEEELVKQVESYLQENQGKYDADTLLLAGLCISECQNNQHPLIEEIASKICQFWQSYPDASFIEGIVVALGKIGNEKAVEVLIKALDDSDNWVRGNPAEALGKIGNEKAVEALIKALDHSDDGVRGNPAEALGKIGNAETVTKIMQKTDLDIYDSDIFLSVRKLAIRHSRELTHPLTTDN